MAKGYGGGSDVIKGRGSTHVSQPKGTSHSSKSPEWLRSPSGKMAGSGHTKNISKSKSYKGK